MATIGRWSTRRPWRAIAVWLAFVVVAVGAMIATGTKSLENGAIGESARGYTMLDENRLWPPPREVAYLHSDTLRTSDPAFHAAIRDVVRHGITATAGVVTSAPLVMFAVFSIFGSLSALDVKQAGVGLAAAVLIDSTIVRAVLLPASMKLLGDWNWYLPRFLERLWRAAPEGRPAREPV